MSSADIAREVERETAAELEALLGAAESQAMTTIEAARVAVRARVQAAIAREEPALRAEAGRRVNAARSRLGQRRVEVVLARTDAVHAAARERLDAIARDGEDGRWEAALRGLTREALALAGPGATVRVRGRDADLVRAFVEASAGILEIATDDAPPGVVARARDGRMEVDATIPVRLARARVRLGETVAAQLGIAG
jgi:vacuolar-type H+-ATPase subunit E/Vma4